MLQIEFIDGIPCITLENEIIYTEEDLKKKSQNSIMPEFFTEVQETKEKSYYESVLDELKKKFGEL